MITVFRKIQDIGISHCKQKFISSNYTWHMGITDHVTKEEGRTASGHTPKGIAAQ